MLDLGMCYMISDMLFTIDCTGMYLEIRGIRNILRQISRQPSKRANYMKSNIAGWLRSSDICSLVPCTTVLRKGAFACIRSLLSLHTVAGMSCSEPVSRIPSFLLASTTTDAQRFPDLLGAKTGCSMRHATCITSSKKCFGIPLQLAILLLDELAFSTSLAVILVYKYWTASGGYVTCKTSRWYVLVFVFEFPSSRICLA
jgi:hypothetical protein